MSSLAEPLTMHRGAQELRGAPVGKHCSTVNNMGGGESSPCNHHLAMLSIIFLFRHFPIGPWQETISIYGRPSISSSSCHQTVVFHLSTQDIAVSFNFDRSSKVQGRARRVHCSMCAVFSVGRTHSHVVSPSKYCDFFRCSLLRV